MQVTDLLQPDCIMVNAPVTCKEEAIDLLIALLEPVGNLADPVVFRRDVMKREAEGNTALTDGVVIPHAKSKTVQFPALAAITVPQGLDCHALDGRNSHLFFLIAAPEDNDVHVEALAALSKVLMDPVSRDKLIAAESAKAFYQVLRDLEQGKLGETEEAKESYDFLAVTACPAGIAHTYMAAEALEQAAEKMGCSLKVETRGAGGVRNALTEEEIREADAILVAADRTVPMSRFEGKRLLSVSVTEAVHDPKKLLMQLQRDDLPMYEKGKLESVVKVSAAGIPKRFYQHLMNGVSHMLPFVVSGGLLVSLSMMLDSFTFAFLNQGMGSQIVRILNVLGEGALFFMLPILAGYIASSIADRPGLAIGFVGGLLAHMGVTLENPQIGISSGFLGAIIAGFAAGYLVLFIQWATKWMPDRLDSMKVVLVIPLLGTILIGLFQCLVNPFVAQINALFTVLLNAAEGSGGLILGALLGAMMAVDMGGPVNKAAYVFGTAAMASGDGKIMAAVILGGMVPPLITALAVTFFGKEFTETERKSGYLNYILSICFVTEGAIPFAAADPFRVLPACVAGSAVAGGLSMLFGCTVPAPHGGIFIFFLAGNALLYLFSFVAGAFAGMLVLVALKKAAKSKALKNLEIHRLRLHRLEIERIGKKKAMQKAKDAGEETV